VKRRGHEQQRKWKEKEEIQNEEGFSQIFDSIYWVDQV